MTIVFELDGQKFMAMNGGSGHKFNEAISLMVHCQDQKELDWYWKKKLSAGGKEVACGWLTDKFGVSWQIVPKAIGKWISSKDPATTQRVMEQVVKMVKTGFQKIETRLRGRDEKSQPNQPQPQPKPTMSKSSSILAGNQKRRVRD